VDKKGVERRLTAILAADVAGYSRLMGLDDEGTLVALKAHHKALVDPTIASHHGRIFNTTGDGMLVEFGSVVDAVRCAIAIQHGMAMRNGGVPEGGRIVFRIGINIGDIIIDGTDIYGDGVNVAVRLETLAKPGGICISRAARDQVRDKLPISFDDYGEQQVKNIARPIRAFGLSAQGIAAIPTTMPAMPIQDSSVSPVPTKPALTLPDKPSIAVLPFENMSGDPEQEYFADGIVEEIITALSRMRWLFVIARNSSFIYKKRAIDVKQVGRELGVRYILEGSVRKSGHRVRITGQLIDASTGTHLWADRFDGGLEDIFDLQDQVTASVVGAIGPKLEQAEIERVKHKPTESLDAYDYFLRGVAAVHQWTKESTTEALLHFYRSIELDPMFASAYGMAARCFVQRKTSVRAIDRVQEIAETVRLARRAAELGKDDAVALCTAGIALAFVVGDLDEGEALTDRALVLNPNLAWAWLFSGWVKVWLGEPGAAIERVARAMRLSPQDPHSFSMQNAMALSYFFCGNYSEALSRAEMAVREKPSFLLPLCVVAASGAFAGRLAVAQKAMERLRQLDPTLRISNLKDVFPLRRPEDFAMWAEGLRRAGLPE
jgi:TolB-like protein/class 3 adenylate cyclase